MMTEEELQAKAEADNRVTGRWVIGGLLVALALLIVIPLVVKGFERDRDRLRLEVQRCESIRVMAGSTIGEAEALCRLMPQ